MADYDDDPAVEDDFENEDEEMEDVNEADAEADADQEDDANGDEDDDEDQENDDDENGEDDEDEDQPDSPSRRATQPTAPRRSALETQQANPAVVLTSASPHHGAARSPGASIVRSFLPPTRPEAVTAQAYDIVPTMAAPQSTSINAITATPDMHWVFSGGTDGYVRMYNWVDTANGKVPLTVAQKHPFVDSVMKAGSLLTYWENEDALYRTPTKNGEDESKWTSPVYSLAVQHQALWLLSGLESGGINLQTCRHQAGTRITTLREHTSAVSVLTLSQDETQLLSGSWDKVIHDWDLQTGKVKRSFRGSGGQISAIEPRPSSDVPVPEVPDALPNLSNGTFSSNNADKPFPDGMFSDGDDADAPGSPSGSLFGENDHGSLFGEDNAAGGGGGAYGDDQGELPQALEDALHDPDQDAPGEIDIEMDDIGLGGPVQPPETGLAPPETVPEAIDAQHAAQIDGNAEADGGSHTVHPTEQQSTENVSTELPNGLPHAHEPLTAPPTNDNSNATMSSTTSDLPPQSESTFLSTSIDGTLRIWDRRVAQPIAVVHPQALTPPWCTGACWSPDGNTFYLGRRNNTVDEYNIHKLSSTSHAPSRQFKFQAGSGPVYAVRAMPNGRHLVCASQDILRIYDLRHERERDSKGRSSVPFTIVPGHRGGFISAVHVDPTCRFMLSASGNRGWEGGGTEVLLGYEIG
ncbi:hypothetical protein BAUCODRAFT_49500, partial [Baudoinia panamericana UAMH 10762]